MSSENLIVGLDIGTSKISVAIAEPAPNGGVEILGVGIVDSEGLRRGVVVNIEAAMRSIAQAIERAENMAGREVEEVVTGISGAHIDAINSRGVVAVTAREREITLADVQRVMDAARAVNLPIDREILHVIPQEYIVDDQRGIKDPIDMIGVRLEAEVHIVTGSVTAAQNILKCVNRAGFRVKEIALDVLVGAEAVLSHDEKELGTMVIDIGGGTTNMMLYQNGAPYFTGVVPIGADEVTHDLSLILKSPREQMEKLKLEHGICYVPMAQDMVDTIVVPGVGGTPPIAVSGHELAEYIQPRMEEIFQLVKDRVEHDAQFTRWAGLAGGIVLTGGGALLPGAAELAAEVFETPARVGFPLGVSSSVKDIQRPDLATAVGLVLHYARLIEGTEAVDQRPKTKEKQAKKGGKLRGWFRNFFD